MNKRFLFFENFKSIADKLPDDMRLKFYDALLSYVFDGVESDDVMIAALITAIKPSLDKEETRGGVREGAGRPKQNAVLNNQKNQNNSNEIKNIQNAVLNNQKNQSFLETETEVRNGSKKQETETEKEKKENTKEKKYDALFAEFWSAYPKQRAGSKEKALKAYIKAIDERKAEPPQILNACKCYAESREVLEGYAKGCAAWLNDDRYLCDYGQNQVKTENGDFYVEW